jgi:hypothetical protein
VGGVPGYQPCVPALRRQRQLRRDHLPDERVRRADPPPVQPDTGQWSLYWAGKRTGTLFPAVTGAFKDGTGEFFGEDTHNDVSVLARFRWTDITADSAHWEQPFSTDGGETWLDNWYMDSTRRP